MDITITFLGTAASIPSSSRAHPAIAIKRRGEIFLFDCGEGTQRQMIRAKVGFNRKTRIFITHMHGDHILGLPGLIQTMSLLGRDKPLQIYGPKGITNYIEAMFLTVEFTLKFPIQIFELEEEGLIIKEREYEVYSANAEHSVLSLAYAICEKPRPGKFHVERAYELDIPKGPLWHCLQQGCTIDLEDGRKIESEEVLDPPKPGRKVVVVGDTKPSKNIVDFSIGADVLVHESTFADDLVNQAKEDYHSTPSGTALIAKKAKVRTLILTHISARYKDTKAFIKEAKGIFSNILVAEDLMIYKLSLDKEQFTVKK